MNNVRRKLLCQYCSKELGDYITDGLILNLDGTDKQASGNYVWVDKAQGITFTKVGNVIDLDNGFSFITNNKGYLSGSRELTDQLDNLKNYTVEVVAKITLDDNVWGPIVSFCAWNSVGWGIQVSNSTSFPSKPNLKFSIRESSNQIPSYKAPYNQLFTCSMLYLQDIYINGSKVTTKHLQDASAYSNDLGFNIGARITRNNPSASRYFQGNIHAIRVYNRQLTQDEILHNQSIDIVKYNI